MKTLILTFALLTSFSLQANDKFVCSSFYAYELADVVKEKNRSDKFNHCAVSCMLTLRCGKIDAYSIGLIKEFLDLLGMGHAEMDDLRANKYGINLVKNKEALNDDQCMDLCALKY